MRGVAAAIVENLQLSLALIELFAITLQTTTVEIPSVRTTFAYHHERDASVLLVDQHREIVPDGLHQKILPDASQLITDVRAFLVQSILIHNERKSAFENRQWPNGRRVRFLEERDECSAGR